MATIASYPLDLLRTRFAAQGQHAVYCSIADAVRKIRANEGYAGFYRGLWPSVAQIIPYMAIMFASYGWMRRALSDSLGVDVRQIIIRARDMLTTKHFL